MKKNKEINYKRNIPPKEKNWREHKKRIRKQNEKRLIEEVEKTKRNEESQTTVKKQKIDVDETATCSTSKNNSSDLEDQMSKGGGRFYTISIALPGSILENAQSPELKTYLAGQIARAAAIFQVDEIVVFDENAAMTQNEFESFTSGKAVAGQHKYNCNLHLAKILQFLECPQYLRKQFFPIQKELQYAGLLNPIDCLHHFRSDDLSIPYREGVVLNKPTKSGKGSYCNVGLSKEVQIDKELQPDIRVTVKLSTCDLENKMKGVVVSPTEPVQTHGYYWGYTVRLAKSISAIFEDCPFDVAGYDLTIGTSEKGQNVDMVKLPEFRHLLVVFGGVKGLESCVDNDQSTNVDDPSGLFRYYLDTCPEQGSRTIRTEEAILISMSALRPKILRCFKKRNISDQE